MSDLRDLVRELYGVEPADLAQATGVVHVTAVWGDPSGGHTVLRINEDTPKSETDYFVLRLVRARADAIVATGRILRDEPDVLFDLAGKHGDELAAWRRDELGKTDRPTVAILTSGRHVDFTHPAFAACSMLLYSASPIDAPEGVEVVHDPEASVERLVAHLRERGAQTISIEAGPSTARSLYEGPVIDELLLSVLDAPSIPDSVVGGSFFDDKTLSADLERRHEASVDGWRFSRWIAKR